MRRKGGFGAALFLLLMAALMGCSNPKVAFSGGDADKAAPDSESAGDGDIAPLDGDTQDADSLEAESEAEAEFGRELVEGTEGFCRPDGLDVPDTNCTKAADCVGYFAAPDLDCGLGSDGMGWTSNECRFARKATFPQDPACTADELCRGTPRACVDGHCKADWPKHPCAATSDCKLYDLGCACVAGTSPPSLDFGRSCPASGACESTMEPGCVRGYCTVVGPYMDAAIDYLCRKFPTACLNGNTAAPSEEQIATCIASAKEDHYARAALQWAFLRAVGLAQTCNGLLEGPGESFYRCLSSK